MTVISTDHAPPPAGHYVQARVHDDVVYVSGQLPVDVTSETQSVGSIEEQTQQALDNVAAVLRAAGTDVDRVIKTTVYVADIALWDRVNEVYAAFFGDHRPARAVVPTRELHYGYQVEIEAIAELDNSDPQAASSSIEPAQVQALPTPALLIDQGRLVANLQRMQARADANEVALRPHVKTHKSIELAQRQQSLGAEGLTAAKPSEAEVFVKAGFGDVRVAYPVVGPEKLRRLAGLMEQGTHISFCVDTMAGARAASDFFAERRQQASVLIKVDCGYGRVGVRWDDPESVDFAATVFDLPGLDVTGILTHAGQAYRGANGDASEQERLRQVADAERDRMLSFAQTLEETGILASTSRDDFEISIGSTPSMAEFENREEKGFTVTEIRPGTYVFNDCNLVALGAARTTECALTVRTRIVSRRATPSGTQLILDAGKKVFTTDQPYGTTGYGQLLADPATMTPMAGGELHTLSEEHGWVHVDGSTDLAVGDCVRVVPNHACVTVHTQNQMYLISGPTVLDTWTVDARDGVR
jgi:reactive intermediate/imine deaminase